MGAQIGVDYALGGHPVTLVTRSAASGAAALSRAEAVIEQLRAAGLAGSGQGAPMRASDDVVEACRGASIVVESVPEDLSVKVEVLRLAAGAAPDAILASDTSALSPTALGEGCGAPERLLVTHYWNPPTLMPLVEVVPGQKTAPDVVERMLGILRALGKQPVVVGDIPGFVWNRLQMALIREAVAVVRQGAASPADVDLIMREGLGRRWSLIGPFETMALGGRELFAKVAALLYPELDCAVPPEAILEIEAPAPDSLEQARGRRDRALIELMRADQAKGAEETQVSPAGPPS